MIGKNIKAARLDAGLSQSELARQIGVSPQSVQQWEMGVTAPRRARIQKLAECLNTTVPEIELGNMMSEKGNAHLALSEQETNLIKSFRQMDISKQKHLLLIVESISDVSFDQPALDANPNKTTPQSITR